MELKIIVPDDISVLPAVRSFISSSAEIAGFDSGELVKFSLIAEEAFVYTLRISFEEGDKSEIKIVAKIDKMHFFISFFDKGLPFGGYALKDIDSLSKTQLTILKNNCDKLEWINHGKKGKELRIKFTRPTKDITQYEFVSYLAKPKPSDNISIEFLDPKESYQVSQIVYKTYGYTYPNEDIYYPETIENLNKENKLVSVVAIDKAYGKIIGHYAIERYDFNDVAELGQAVIIPEYRGRNILGKMRAKLEESAKQFNIKGLYSQPVASHIKTQKVNEKFSSKACGVSFGLVPKDFNYKKMDIKPITERETCFMYFKPLMHMKRYIYIPGKHESIIKAIYDNMGLEHEKPKKKLASRRSVVDAKYKASWGFATINVLNIGDDFVSTIKSSFNQLRISTNAETVFLNVPLCDRPIDDFIDSIEEIGFFFCGVIPYAVEGKDIIRFQYLNTSIDVSRIHVFGEFAKRIFDYSVSMMNMALGL